MWPAWPYDLNLAADSYYIFINSILLAFEPAVDQHDRCLEQPWKFFLGYDLCKHLKPLPGNDRYFPPILWFNRKLNRTPLNKPDESILTYLTIQFLALFWWVNLSFEWPCWHSIVDSVNNFIINLSHLLQCTLKKRWLIIEESKIVIGVMKFI